MIKIYMYIVCMIKQHDYHVMVVSTNVPWLLYVTCPGPANYSNIQNRPFLLLSPRVSSPDPEIKL